MISTELIKDLVKEKVADTNLFLVDVKVDAANNVAIFVDSNEGVDVQRCVEISKHVEEALDREQEDFALEVSSPGIGYPFKVIEQYQKAVGRTIEVLFFDGLKIDGKLILVEADRFEIEHQVKEKPEGAKRFKLVDKTDSFKFDEVKSVIEIIKF